MTHYQCDVCRVFEYDSVRGDSVTGIKPGTEPSEFPDGWKCPICMSDKSHLEKFERISDAEKRQAEEYIIACPVCGAKNVITAGSLKVRPAEKAGGDRNEPSEWNRISDKTEDSMEIIHRIAASGESFTEPMRTRKKIVSWDDILICGAQIAKIPLNDDDYVSTRTVIGPYAKYPLVIETPVFITHMSYGALSKEMCTALSIGSSASKTAIGSGEGGILEEAIKNSYRFIFEYVPNRYSVTDENLKRVDAVEIKIGQSAKPGAGGYIPAEKATEEISAMRGFPPHTDIITPASYEDIRSRDDLLKKIKWLREKTGGKPVGVKIAAGNIEDDLEAIVYANPDFITIDGRPGSTAGANRIIKDSTSVPTIYALHRARKYLDSIKKQDISLIITGGLRLSSDFAKALAMGADAVAIGTAALMAAACQQYRLCDTGKCPVGVTTQNPELRKRLKVDISAKKLENFLNVSTEELKSFARLTGNDDVHKMSLKDLCTTNSEISDYTDIRHA